MTGGDQSEGSSSGEGSFRPGTPQQPSAWRLPRARAARSATALSRKDHDRSVECIGDPQQTPAAGKGDAETVAGAAIVCSSSGSAEHGSEQMPVAAGDKSACGATASSAPPVDLESNKVGRWRGVDVCDSAMNSGVSSSSSDVDVQQSSKPVPEELRIMGISESDACVVTSKAVALKSPGRFVVNIGASSSVREPLAPSAAGLLGAHAFDLSSMKNEDNRVQ